ncbi:MAG: response regulator transcription factor [Anaerolineales bacterium]
MSADQYVLIVDDEAYIRVLLTQTLEELEDHGVTLLTASNGREGVETAHERSPALVFLDVMMPYMNGFEACREIKAAHAETYVIMLTAKGQAMDRAQGIEAGADEYINKPFDPDYILERAAAVLGLDIAF